MSQLAEQRFENRRGQAKVVSILLLAIGYGVLLWSGSSLGSAIGTALHQQWNQADEFTIQNDSLLQESVESRPSMNCEELYSWMTEPHLGTSGMQVLLAIPQLIGASKLYMGTQPGKSPTEALLHVDFNQIVQFIFLTVNLFGFFCLSLKMILSGLLEFNLCQWIFEMAWSALLCIILVRCGCWFIVDLFRTELNTRIQSGGDGKEKVIASKEELLLKA